MERLLRGVLLLILGLVADSMVNADSDFGPMDDNGSPLVIVRLYHAFNSDLQYQPRGLITIQNQVPIIKQEPLSPEAIQSLKESNQRGELYHLKAAAFRTLDFDNEPPYQVTSTFLQPCALLQSHLSDQLVINLDLNGKFVFLSAATPGHHCSSVHDPIPTFSGSVQFNTSLYVTKTTLSSGPETKTYLARIEQERQEKLRGVKQDNRSFLAKYWMYIVPVVIFMLISSSFNPEAQGAAAR